MNGFDKTISNVFYSSVNMTSARFVTFAAQSILGEHTVKTLYSLIVAIIRWLL